MTRSELLSAIRLAERESQSASRALGSLRELVELILKINGEVEAPSGTGELSQHLSDLAHAPKPLLKQWAAVCRHDPLLEYLIKSRKSYARTDRTRGKGARGLEVTVLVSYQGAVEVGFKGSRNQWEHLLRIRG